MIRHSIHTGLGRGRPEISRLSEGIASSLRQFSIAQARCAADDGKPSSSRQRSAAAASELLSMNENKPRSGSPSDIKRSSSPGTPTPTPTPQIPKVINVSSLRGGSPGGFSGIRKFVDNNSESGPNSRPSAAGGGIIRGGIIRGGFRGRGGGASSGGRGGGSFAGRGGGTFAGRGGGSFAGRGGGSFAGRGGGSFRGTSRGGRGRGRGGRGRGRRGGSDDRPKRDQKRETRAEKKAEEAYQRFIATGKDVDPEVAAHREALEIGVARFYKPSAPKDLLVDLAKYAPSIAANSALARGSVATNQARLLAGGIVYHPTAVPSPNDARKEYKETHGVFFPSAEARAYVDKATKNVSYQKPPEETQTAVLDASILGKYDGPEFADLNDTIGTIRSYVKRHGTWNAAAERSIEARVKSLLPAAAAAAAAAKGTAKGAAKGAVKGTTKAQTKKA